ncbi:methyltransferase [Pseudomonas syringae pv. spinaceae]|uniref:Methyltransferase n=1 Tax=Pseudomonas syringae pv. spinaceae TaxID=264459 RepID=A0A0N8T6S7_PSESX|nr:methyltransferase [Pseudomonas syringae pv. spinaceae]
MSAPPAPIATPTTPALRASESLTPSPTTIGRKPLAISPITRLSLSSGNACACTSAMPISRARLSATLCRSPVSNNCRPMPSSRSSSSAAWASGLTLSASSSQARNTPSSDSPASGPSCAGTCGVTIPSCSNNSGRPSAASPCSVAASTPSPWRSRVSVNGSRRLLSTSPANARLTG